MAADPKPAARVNDSSAGTEKVRGEGRCRVCGVPGLPYSEGGILNRAHLVGKGVRGDDLDANIIPLCGSGTTGCHAAFDGGSRIATAPSLLAGATGEEIRRLVGAALLTEERDYIVGKKGAAWLEDRFCLSR